MSLGRYLTLDGGLGTELCDSFGHANINGDPLWSTRLLITDIESIKKAHTSFLTNGADVIETATYQCSVGLLQKEASVSLLGAVDIIKSAAFVAKEAIDDFWQTAQHQGRLKPLVAGSIGPYGACLLDYSEFTGTYVDNMSIQDLVNWHRPRMKALLEAGVDILAIETIPAQKEAEALALLLQEFATCQAWLTFSCKNGMETCHGENFAEAVARISSCKQIIAVGINCTGPCYVESLLREIPDMVKRQKTIVIYPNSGEHWSVQTSWTGKEKCQPLSTFIGHWMSLGAAWIGGCCRVTATDINQIRQAMHAYIEGMS